MTSPEPSLPILLGVTGHRDISPAAIPAVTQSVTSVLEVLQTAFASSLVVVSALAEGSDQLVATIALRLGIRLVAVSPMPLDLYRKTMSSPQAAAALDLIWHDALVMQRIELPLLQEFIDTRNDAAQYEQLGLLLSRQSHILLALWDGTDNEPHDTRESRQRTKRGGSAHVVAMRQFGERYEVSPQAILGSRLFSCLPPRLELARSGPILHIVTDRSSGHGRFCRDAAGEIQPGGTLLWWSDLPSEEPRHRLGSLAAIVWPQSADSVRPRPHAPGWTKMTAAHLASALPVDFRRIRQADIFLAASSRLRSEKSRRHSYLCPDRELSPPRDLPGLARLRALFDAADADASRYQRRLFGTWLPGLPWPGARKLRLGMSLWFALAVPVATLFCEIFSEYGHRAGWLGLYLLTILVPSLVYVLLVGRRQWQGRYQDHRALAEGVRIQFFWAASGVPIAVSDNYMRHQAGTLGWIRLALRGPAVAGLAAALAIFTPDPNFVRRWWIEDQMRYFRRQAELQEAASIRLQRIIRIIVALVILLALGLFGMASGIDGYASSLGVPQGSAQVALVGLGTLPAVAAFFVIIAEGRAYEEHAHAYTQSHSVFAEAERQSRQLDPGDPAGWRDLLISLGQEALTENATWIHTHRSRPVANRLG